MNTHSAIGNSLKSHQNWGFSVGVRLRAPLPRAYEWVDGSAYVTHVELVRKARGAKPPETLHTDPLVYQGGSGVFLGHNDDIVLNNEQWGLDFEAEVCAILGDTPQGVTKDTALDNVKLLLLCNDITLRNLIPTELKKGFGFFNSKPATAFSPFAITPDELGPAWREGRIHLNLNSWLNGEHVGSPNAGPEMHFSFADLIEHICKTRSFVAGTILGSGTVSNQDPKVGYSCIAEQRMREIIQTGSASTPFLKEGDEIAIDMSSHDGSSIFGTILAARGVSIALHHTRNIVGRIDPTRIGLYPTGDTMKDALGIIAIDSIHYYVHDLERTREYYTNKLDFTEMGASSELLASQGKQHSVVFQAGQCRVVVSEPRGTGGRAWRYLQKHPEGVGTVVFRVEDIEKTFNTLESRGGTPMSKVHWSRLVDGSQFGQFSITTPFGDTTFRFIQREGRTIPYPGFKPHPKLRGGTNRFQFSHFDHVTGNFPTIQPIALWLRFVLGFQEYTAPATVSAQQASNHLNGAGIKTVVMWDPYSKVKFVLMSRLVPTFGHHKSICSPRQIAAQVYNTLRSPHPIFSTPCVR